MIETRLSLRFIFLKVLSDEGVHTVHFVRSSLFNITSNVSVEKRKQVVLLGFYFSDFIKGQAGRQAGKMCI